MSETGSVKFSCEHVAETIALFAEFAALNEYRRKLHALGFIGVGADGVGFGNVSVRDRKSGGFHITGSGTGNCAELKLTDCAKVVRYDFAKNWLRCEGGTLASSESLTHAAVYEAEPQAGAVIHGHNLKWWNALRDKAPTTSTGVAYGTPEMAHAVKRLWATTTVGRTKFFVMEGHREGLVSFGRDLGEAFAVLLAAGELVREG